MNYERVCYNCKKPYTLGCCGDDDCNGFFGSCKGFELRDELAKIENGNLIEPPCKIDDPLFEIDVRDNDVTKWYMTEGHCSMLQQKADKSWKVRFSYALGPRVKSCHDVAGDQFGKTMFTSKVEAEAQMNTLRKGRENK